MPRTKGSTNTKSTTKRTTTTASVDSQIKSITADIDALSSTLKEKRTELRKLKRNQTNAEKTKILAAVSASGKSYNEIMSFLCSVEPAKTK